MKDQFLSYFTTLPPLEQAGYFLWPSLASTELSSQEEEILHALKPSGLIFFKRNLANVTQSKQLVDKIRCLISPLSSEFTKELIFCIDEEGGRVSRLPVDGIRGKSALAFADDADTEGLVQQVNKQCQVAKEIGINTLLAPVADILTEPSNTVMGDRCFGRNAETVSKYANLVHNTLRKNGVWSCAKHFPGHGNTVGDSHVEFCQSLVSLKELQEREWIPFVQLIEQGVPFIMAAHVLVPSLDNKNPATLSPTILTSYLREKMGFSGLILSDDLRMNAIALHYGVQKRQDAFIENPTTGEPQTQDPQKNQYLAQAGLDALKAGCDILLSCQSVVEERIIADAIVLEMQKDKGFYQLMEEKAWRITRVLSKK